MRYPFLALLSLVAAGAGVAAHQCRDRRPSGAAPRAHAAIPASSSTESFKTPSSPAAAGASAMTGGRLPISAAQSRAELSAGGILQPVRTILNQKGPMRYGSWQWDERGIADGPIWVRADLDSQIISVFRGSHEIGTAVMVYGTDGMDTPTGIFPIKARIRDHRSSLYGSPMPFTLRLTDDGVSIHGSSVRFGAATHGCIGVPIAFAKRLFEAVGLTDQVLIVAARKAPQTA